MEYIKTVKENGNGEYLVNNGMSVPQAEGNRHYRDIQEWILEGGVVEPFETPEETIIREAMELEEKEWQEYITSEIADKKDNWEKAGKPKYLVKN